MFFYYDATYLLVLAGVILCVIASANVNQTYKKYSTVGNARQMTAEQAARTILDQAGIRQVRIERVGGNLTDHYDPRSKVLRLSETVYNSQSVAAIGVAAHECGHAIQDDVGYVPIKIRGAIVPAVNFGSALCWPLFLIGLLMGAPGLVNAGIILFSLVVVFQLVTLPVEFNASGRALRILDGTGILSGSELQGAGKVLRAAALTYVASALSTILQLLRLVLLSGRRRN
ncbi:MULTISPECIES: zinc metallopeptidase [Blautia]|uniref:zinc metallopeptidase n=1 Tax=Blautia TaxID=572511 RepID=UPI000BA436F1|nr:MULTISPECIES: zinc metallopeptidase [Blautia]